MLIIMILFFCMIILFEVPVLIREKYWRELLAFSSLLLLGFLLYFLRYMGVQFPSVTKMLIDVFKLYLPQ